MRSLAGTILAPLYSSPHDHVVAVVLRFPCRWPISPASQRNELPRRLPRVSLRSQLYSSTSSSPPRWVIQAIRCGQGVCYRARVLQPELFQGTSLAFLQPTYPPKQDGGL